MAQPRRATIRPPLRLRVFVSAVVVVAAAVLLLSARHGVDLDRTALFVAAVLLVMVGVAHAFPVHLAPRVQVSIDTAPAFAAAVLLPLPLAILVSAAGIAAGELSRRTALIQMGYNVAVAGLRTAAAGAVFTALAPAPLGEELEPAPTALALIGAALAMYLVNAGLIDLVIAVQRRTPPFAGWWRRHRDRAGHEASLYLLGVLVAVIGAETPAALVLLPVPSVAVYRALRDGVAVRMRGRDALEELADMVEGRVPFLAGHSRRVAELARSLALRAGMSADEAERVHQAARVHNIGNAGVRPGSLMKSTSLSGPEWAGIRDHAALGAHLLSRFPEFTADPEVVHGHHERWDGRGYPRGLRGEAIPKGSRIIAVVDALVAMRSRRPYRPALPPEIVRAELLAGRGTQFDPALVDALIDLLDQHPDFAMDGPYLTDTFEPPRLHSGRSGA